MDFQTNWSSRKLSINAEDLAAITEANPEANTWALAAEHGRNHIAGAKIPRSNQEKPKISEVNAPRVADNPSAHFDLWHFDSNLVRIKNEASFDRLIT